MAEVSSKSRRCRRAIQMANADPLPHLAKIGPYFTHALLGRGGQGTLYLASADGAAQTQLVALKVFNGSGGLPDRERIRRSLNIQYELLEERNRRVPEVIAADLEADQPWVATKFAGGSLQRVNRRGQNPKAMLVDLASDLALCLGSAHRLGLLHRDVKPGNVLKMTEGSRANYSLCDFDLAKTWIGGTDLTTFGVGLGTQGYSAPEQLLGAQHARPASDTFGVAATLVFAATCTEPQHAVTGLYDPDRSVQLSDDAEERLGSFAEWVTRGLAFRPEDRPDLREIYRFRPLGRGPSVGTKLATGKSAAPEAGAVAKGRVVDP